MWRGISRYPKGVPKSAGEMPMICSNYAKEMPNICSRYTVDIPKIS